MFFCFCFTAALRDVASTSGLGVVLWPQSLISSLLCILHITQTRGSHHRLRLSSGIFYTTHVSTKTPVTGVFSSMLSYTVGQGENKRKEMRWEKTKLFVGEDFSSAFTEKQKSATETVVLSDQSSPINHNFMDYNNPQNKYLYLFHEHHLVWGFWVLLSFCRGFLLQWLLCGFVVGFFLVWLAS